MNTTTFAQMVVWLIIGGLAGTVAGMIVKQQRRGFGWLTNLIVGMVGALLGGWLFDVLNIDLGVLSQITIAFDQIVAAIFGSLLVILIFYLVQRNRTNKQQQKQPKLIN